jgi:MYXO-CTERM domain-containing protein
MRNRSVVLAAAVLASAIGSVASASTVVFDNGWTNGFFTPFNASTPSSIRYGDSGWLSNGFASPIALEQITLGLVAYNGGTTPVAAGTTDLSFTFNNGDPSGLVFGPGTTLKSTTISGVQLPELQPGEVQPISVTISLDGVVTSGGFNNIGWSVGVNNFGFGGSLGFQLSTAFSQIAGFYTNNASFYNGSNWSLFAFGSDPNTGVANLVATVTVPAPGAAALLGVAGLVASRRRRA